LIVNFQFKLIGNT